MDAPALAFSQGVASGDPQPEAVMLWTRAQPIDVQAFPPQKQYPMLLQVSREPDYFRYNNGRNADCTTITMQLDHLFKLVLIKSDIFTCLQFAK